MESYYIVVQKADLHSASDHRVYGPFSDEDAEIIFWDVVRARDGKPGFYAASIICARQFSQRTSDEIIASLTD